PYLDTKYTGVEFTATKRLSRNWQMVAGLTIGKNTGGINQGGTSSGQTDVATVGGFAGGELNDPNNTRYPEGIIGNDSEVAFRLSGSYLFPAKINLAGSLISNSGYPYVSTYSVTRAAVAPAVALTRANQTVFLSQR